jgi:hypothetical protein
VKFDENGNYDEFSYNSNYLRGISPKDELKAELYELFG